MTKSKVFILAVIVFFIIMGGLFFLLPQEEKQGDVISLTASRVLESPYPDDETSGIVQTSKQETWNVINVNKKNILDINTFNDFGKRSDLVIPAKYDGKKINRFDISFYNDDVTTLKNVTIENGIETIGGGFAQCSKLEKVVIPSSVTKIEKGEFRYSKDTVTLYVKKGSYAEKYAKDHPEEQVTFLSVGFETTTPAGCLSVKQAKEDGISNYSLLVANKTMPGAYEALKGSADVFLYPGHVNAITGTRLCEALTEEGVSGVVAGFTAKELLTALAVALVRFQEGKPFFVNCYPRVVTREGSREAQRLVNELMEGCDSEWRGLGIIPGSGMQLREEWEAYDARKKYNMPKIEGKANPACRCGDVLQGKCKPSDCKVFGKGCTPQHPIGACMVSGEGACSAYYQYS